MATSDQIKGLIKAYLDHDDDKFKTTVLQIAAYEAKQGHVNIAQDLKGLIEKASLSKNKIVQINKQQNSMLYLDNPSQRLCDLVISNEVYDRIKRILNEFTQRSKLHDYGLQNRRKILLEGAPGTGKTMTASVIASELHLPLFIVQMDKLVTKFMGETSIKLRQIFDSINEIMGVYLFDEFDAIGADRSIDNEVGEMRRILNSFLQFIEQDNSDSIIIAATNNQKILDQALYRRFDDVLHYSLPTSNDIRKIFEMKFGNFAISHIKFEPLIKKASSLSHAEITRICDDVIKNSILNDKIFSQEDIERTINERLSVYSKKEA